MSEAQNPLAQAFDFTTTDLKMNRNQRLSGRQRRRLWLHWWLLLAGGLLLMLAPLLLTWGLLLWGESLALRQVFWDERALPGYAIALALGLLYLFFNWRSLLLALDLLRGRVQAVVAPAQVWGRYLLLDERRFVVEQPGLEFLKSGMRYRAFILPLSQTLLSIEFSD